MRPGVSEDAIYDAAPLRELLENFADEPKLKASGSKLLHESVPGIHNWVYASSAMPVFFDPLKTRGSDGVEEQWADGGVRNVTPLGAALEMNPRGVIAVRALPRPKAGRIRTFPNLIKIGLRAVDILESGVSANDAANATYRGGYSWNCRK